MTGSEAQAMFIDGLVSVVMSQDPVGELGRPDHPGQPEEIANALAWVGQLPEGSHAHIVALAREVQEQTVFNVLALIDGASGWDGQAGELKLIYVGDDGSQALLTDMTELDPLHDLFMEHPKV